jgi:putative ABC transport system ATP-binding protein
MTTTAAYPENISSIDAATPPDGLLTLESLSKSYLEGDKRHTVLKDVTIRFSTGEFVAILGKSGSGKTTLLNLISGIDLPERGTLWLGRQNLSAMNDQERTLLRRKKIGFIFQFFNLIPTLTVWENLILPLELNGAYNASSKQSAADLLKEVGLADRQRTYPDRLSGGEQQRVAIARALVHNPSLVLADEPTGNLDEDTGRQVMALLDRLTRQAGKNIILVTHSLEAAHFADRILYLRDGKLEDQPH